MIRSRYYIAEERKKMRHQLLYISLAIGLISCNNQSNKEQIGEKTTPSIEYSTNRNTSNNHSELPSTELSDDEKFVDTVLIDYEQNKELLDILPLVPDSAMASWEWSKKERAEMVDFIRVNNFMIDTTKIYNNIQYVRPNTFGTSVVDGFWSMSLYKTNPNEYLMITDDINGDDNNIMCFEFASGMFKPVQLPKVFGRFVDELLMNEKDAGCKAELEEHLPTFDYNFKETNTVKVSSWYIKEEEFKTCLKGNTLYYKFNPEEKRFDLQKISWEKYVD